MSKYTIKTEVEAVLLINKDAVSIQAIADMLPGVPHFFTNDGIVFPNPDEEDDTVTYGNYVIKEAHGISAMSKALFESVSTQLDVPYYDSVRDTDMRIGKLKEYLNQLPEHLMGKEVWLGYGGVSSQCAEITPLDRRDDSFDIILEARS